ncbi:hypothetical protein Q9R38_26035 [Priestia aryabhattai]|uniref:hypothetical protein n=1 Tax=Priestia aryabhattai TaxID=412384 RepID=UPI00288156EA|nr:hypothetical protein [Priestia aryabhattai]MDT0150004.1 hypothetical protein [Priestia aryabhattai]MDT0155574.1 hypothetical protein [Priestia aryabhattai]
MNEALEEEVFKTLLELNKRVADLEKSKESELTVTDLSFIKDILMRRAGEVSQEKYHINEQLAKNIIQKDYHEELLVDLVEESRQIDEVFAKINNQIIK